MAKQWTKEEKIKILSELSSSNASTIAKKYNISRDSILRWNRQVKKLVMIVLFEDRVKLLKIMEKT
ncbi:transposase [Williamsoniiplasma lucivorax]|uniref:Transposase n=1 Tax=Williamsoniiplasma lucivorax TaxID=209274 RepID=A0A2S5RAI5_9MOLU|nr:transposase [Williamsoniiplasma lucivorax]